MSLSTPNVWNSNVPLKFQGATGRPLLTFLIDAVLRESKGARPIPSSIITRPRNCVIKMVVTSPAGTTASAMVPPAAPSLQLNGLSSITEDPSSGPAFPSTSTDRAATRLNMLRKMRPPPFRFAWTLYHQKHTTDANYESELTLLLENIITIKPFWEMVNTFPLENLKMKDSVHFFKRGVKPVWEDPRNVKGGSWTFRVPKAQSEEFWKETLLAAVGEQFGDAIQPGDDLNGISISRRFHSDLITLWNRDGTNQKSIDGILAVLLSLLPAHLKPSSSGQPYYKKHSEHKGFEEVVTAAEEKRKREGVTEMGEQKEAKVGKEEAERVMVEEAEAEEERGE